MKNICIVLGKYPDAWLSRSPNGDMFYVVPSEKSIGSIGAGRTRAGAWNNAAEVINSSFFAATIGWRQA